MMSSDCDDPACSKENNYWKNKLEMPEFNYLQPKFQKYDSKKPKEQEKPKIAGSLDIYMERNCKIIQECKKKAAGGSGKPQCPKGK